jgi:diguanylate cyclase (GGDEF)-like protein/PAS domain S-box-containing protein
MGKNRPQTRLSSQHPAGRTGRDSFLRRRSLQQAIRYSEERYRMLVEQLPVAVYRTTSDGKFVEANPALAHMLGFRDPVEVLRMNARDFYVRRQDRTAHLRRLSEASTSLAEFELRRPDGRRFWVRDHAGAGAGRAVHGLKGSHDITERKGEAKLRTTLLKLRQANEELASLSLADDLTGLNNRRGFFTLGRQLLRTAVREKKQVFLAFIDVDGLKDVNDACGHPVGDQALRSVAHILRQTLRAVDIIGRIGGDEFAILALRPHNSRERALLRRLELKVREFNRRGSLPCPLSLSMGIVRYDCRRFATLEDFLAHADRVMYEKKKSQA